MVLEAEKMCGRYAEGTNLITIASVDGDDTVYSLKMFSERTGVRMWG
jgi:hypothetical protein